MTKQRTDKMGQYLGAKNLRAIGQLYAPLSAWYCKLPKAVFPFLFVKHLDLSCLTASGSPLSEDLSL